MAKKDLSTDAYGHTDEEKKPADSRVAPTEPSSDSVGQHLPFREREKDESEADYEAARQLHDEGATDENGKEAANESDKNPAEIAKKTGLAQPGSSPEILAPDSQHLTPSPIPAHTGGGYLPQQAAEYALRPAVNEFDYRKPVDEQPETVKDANKELQDASKVAAEHYSVEGREIAPNDPELTKALQKTHGLVPIAMNEREFVGDASDKSGDGSYKDKE